MRDELFDRDYQQARAEMNLGIDRGLARLARLIEAGAEAFHRAQWRAPWRPEARRDRTGVA